MLDKRHAFKNHLLRCVQKERKQLKDWIDVPNRWSSVGDGLEATLDTKPASGPLRHQGATSEHARRAETNQVFALPASLLSPLLADRTR